MDATTFTFAGLFNILWYFLAEKDFVFLGVTFQLIDLVYYSAIMGVFAFFIRKVIYYWEGRP